MKETPTTTVILELNPDIEAAGKAETQARDLAVESYLQAFLEQALPPAAEQDRDTIRRKRLAILDRLHGKYAGIPGGSEEFAAQKEEEKAREERFWRENE